MSLALAAAFVVPLPRLTIRFPSGAQPRLAVAIQRCRAWSQCSPPVLLEYTIS
jgi:hypothetical protein